MDTDTIDATHLKAPVILSDQVTDELAHYEQQIEKYLAGELDETKMQKLRLQFGTYAQRQEGVQMQRIKFPGGALTSAQLTRLADTADRFASGFIHFTTREDAQLYYVRLAETPDLLRSLAEANITTREACGNTVRNITACYRAGMSHTEAFDVTPYVDALFRYLVRNKYNQNLGRKVKIAFEGCAEDHSALRVHDIGFWAVSREIAGQTERGFRVYLGGGIGTTPRWANLYTDFLPAAELLNFSAAVLRVFDRYGERKSRMKARMKFLVQTMGWDALLAAIDSERTLVGALPLDDYFFAEPEPASLPQPGVRSISIYDSRATNFDFAAWLRDSVIPHKHAGWRGVHVRLRQGDITAERARGLAEIARTYSGAQLRISIEQNLFLPWVSERDLVALFDALAELGLAERGAATVADVTTCPGADTCRLGIASAKGLGSALADAFAGPLVRFEELARPLKIKISGCPNSCAQDKIANIGFHAAALTNDDKSVPAHMLLLGGSAQGDGAAFGHTIGRFPAKHGVRVVETLLDLFAKERLSGEEFNAFVARIGDQRIKQELEPLREIPAFAEDPQFYEDFGHENERFAVRGGLKGECAGSTIAAVVPTLGQASELLAQSEAFLYHHEYAHAARAAQRAVAAAARVPLYRRLVDPIEDEEAIWEFENLFVLSGETDGAWKDLAATFEQLKANALDEPSVRLLLTEAGYFVTFIFSIENALAVDTAAGA